MATEMEARIQEAAKAALKKGGTNPWGLLREPLSVAAGVGITSVRAIGMQDNSVIQRAIGSPGMRKPNIDVHGFVVQEDTDLEMALAGLRESIQRMAHLRTAVLMPHQDDYKPTHILTRDIEMSRRLAETLPSATIEDDLQLIAYDSGRGHSGPWIVTTEPDAVARRTPIVVVSMGEPHARDLTCGDRVILASSEAAEIRMAYGVGEIAVLSRAGENLTITLQPLTYFRAPVPLSADDMHDEGSGDAS